MSAPGADVLAKLDAIYDAIAALDPVTQSELATALSPIAKQATLVDTSNGLSAINTNVKGVSTELTKVESTVNGINTAVGNIKATVDSAATADDVEAVGNLIKQGYKTSA